MFVLHGIRKRVSTRVAVINSGETYSCGYSVIGALMQANPVVTYKHPIYTGGQSSRWEKVEGVDVIKPITVLKKLDEQKAKFEAGYWDDLPAQRSEGSE